MTTTQSEDPNERVAHPRHYNAHKSGIECIELIEHLPTNFGNATKYVWRCGLKTTETPLRDLKSARWYVERESERRRVYELEDSPCLKTDVVWRSLAHRVVDVESENEGGALGDFLVALLDDDCSDMLDAIDRAIEQLSPQVEDTSKNRTLALAAFGSAVLNVVDRRERGGSLEALAYGVEAQVADYRKLAWG